MMLVKLPSMDVGIVFTHPTSKKLIYAAVSKSGFTEEKKVRSTQCQLYEVAGKDAQLISVGLTVCSQKDNFCKQTGRKIALTRALLDSELGKSDRTLVWEAYINRK